MKLSEAMMLGSCLVKMEPMNMASCAYGVALKSIGLNGEDGGIGPRYDLLIQSWPWLNNGDGTGWNLSDTACSIYEMFDYDVCGSKITFEELIDYVRSVEPSCGECNRFECDCVKEEVPTTEFAQYTSLQR